MAQVEKEKESKHSTKTVAMNEMSDQKDALGNFLSKSEVLQSEGWTVTNIYTKPDNPLLKYHDLEQRSKN